MKNKTRYSNPDSESLVLFTDWENMVERDDELLWDEETELGKSTIKLLGEEEYRKRMHHLLAFYYQNEQPIKGNLHFVYNKSYGFVHCNSDRISVPQIKKMFEVAKNLGGVLFNGSKAVRGEYLEKLITKYTRKKRKPKI